MERFGGARGTHIHVQCTIRLCQRPSVFINESCAHATNRRCPASLIATPKLYRNTNLAPNPARANAYRSATTNRARVLVSLRYTEITGPAAPPPPPPPPPYPLSQKYVEKSTTAATRHNSGAIHEPITRETPLRNEPIFETRAIIVSYLDPDSQQLRVDYITATDPHLLGIWVWVRD